MLLLGIEIGLVIGFLLCMLVSINAYEKGRKDNEGTEKRVV